MLLYIKNIIFGGKILKKIFLVLLVVLLSLSCLLIAVEKNSFNINFYIESYEKYNIEKVTGKNKMELESITEDILTYLRGDRGRDILEPNFNEREILHMEDVQDLFKIGFRLKYISIFLSVFLIAIFWKMKEKKWVKNVTIGLFVNWIILGLLFLMIYFDFSKYFTLFHHIFFSNDLWILDPRTDLLIQMLPEDFFMSMATRIVVFFMGYVSIIQFIGFIIIKRGKGKDEKKERKRKS